MRLHFPSHTGAPSDLTGIAYDALRACQQRGTIAQHLHFKTLSTHSRRGPGAAIEVQFETYERDRGRRAGNTGSYGAMHEGTYTATYDEWGFFLAELYANHPDMICGSPKYATYRDAEDFHYQTGRTYDPTYIDDVGQYGDDFCFRRGRKLIGRRGAGRVHFDEPLSRYATEDPRDAAWLRDFQAGRVF